MGKLFKIYMQINIWFKNIVINTLVILNKDIVKLLIKLHKKLYHQNIYIYIYIYLFIL